jgi:hypothetical protein
LHDREGRDKEARMRIASLVLVSLALAACGGDGASPADAGLADAADSVDGGGVVPGCTSVSDLATVTFTFDEGATSAPTTEVLTGTVYTNGLAIMPDGQTILAGTHNAIWRSEDLGCTWSMLAETAGGSMVLVGAGADGAYGWVDNQASFAQIEGTTVTARTVPAEVYAAAVDPLDPLHVRILTAPGQIHESVDGGAEWMRVGEAVPLGDLSLVYSASFDPADWNHVVVGVLGGGYFVTTTGGDVWTRSTGLSAEPEGQANGFNVRISPVDGDVVWAEGLDLDAPDENAPRHVYRSTDGGASFTAVIDDEPANNLFNGNPLFPHPTDADILYYSFGMSFQNYGTDLYRYDASTGTLTHQHLAPHRINAVAFSPLDPTLMYLGLSHEQIN